MTSGCWRRSSFTTGRTGSGASCAAPGGFDQARFDDMLERIPDLELFERFVELDSSTDGKQPEPLEWFRSELSRRRTADRRVPPGAVVA